jgi:hypothetical protein
MIDANEMTDAKVITISKNDCNTSRRKLLKTTATVAGLVTISPAISFANGKPGEDTQVGNKVAHTQSDQHQHIVSVLNKYAARSKRVTPRHIDRFATGFIEMNGDINYRETFKNLDGEYKLVKLFMKSLNAST